MMTKAKKHTHTHTHTEDTIKQRSLHILFASVSLHYFNKKNDRPVELSQYLIWALEHFILPIKVYICRHIFTCIQGKIDNLKSRTADFLKNCSNWEGNSSCALNYHLALSSWVVSSATIRYYRLRLCWTDESAHLSTRTDSAPLEPPHSPVWALVHFLKVKMTSNIFRQLTSWKKLSWGGQQHHHLIVKPDSRCLASLVAWRTGRECLMPYQLAGFGSVCSISTFPAPHDQDWTLLRGMIITLIDEVKNLDVSPDVNDSICTYMYTYVYIYIYIHRYIYIDEYI